jgi:glycosyltransferase involved in cell wall biosynthesis
VEALGCRSTIGHKMTKIARTAVFFYDGSFVPPVNGAHARAISCLDFLLSEFEEVVVYSYRSHPSQPWNENAKRCFEQRYGSVKLVLDESTTFTRLTTWIKYLVTALWPRLGEVLIRTPTPYITPNLVAVRSRATRPIYVVNYSDGVTKLNGIGNAPVIVDSHDVSTANRAKQLKRRITAVKSILQLRGELALLDFAQVVIAISTFEAAFFRMFLSQAKVLFVPQFPTDDVSTPSGANYEFDFIFVGSENKLNVEGLLNFWQTDTWTPERSIVVCGGVCKDERVKQFASGNRNIVLLGFVDELGSVYASAKAALSPVEGTGLKIKLLDALAHGRPVLASRQSLDGLPPGWGDCVFPFDDPRADEILKNTRALADASAAARSYFRRVGMASELDGLRSLLRELP